MKRLKIILGVVLGMSVVGLLPQGAGATDIPIFPTGSVFRFQTNPTWGISGPTGFNNNFFFTPLNLNESVCVYVYNNNTTNPHTFTGSIVVTGNPNNITPSDGTWQAAATSNNINALTSPGLPGGISALVSGASQVSINFSGSATQAGSPETASITLVQTTGNCFAGNNMISSGLSTQAAASPIQSVSESLSSAFAGFANVINPNGLALHINANNGVKSVYLDKAIISCTATCIVQMNSRANAGATCTTITPTNLKIAFTGSLASTALLENACGTPPSGGAVFSNYDLAANTPVVIDLRGILLVANTSQGFEVGTAAALTGTMRVTFFWYEK